MIKIMTDTVTDMLARLRDSFQGDTVPHIYDNEEPLRSALYSSTQMAVHGRLIANNHIIKKEKSQDVLLKKLEFNEKTLLRVRNLLVEDIRSGKVATPAAEWLLDNFYLIEEQVVIARKHLPKGYSQGLPNLSKGISAGMPRVYDIALEMIAHSDGRVDNNSLDSFIKAYQSITLLTLGELWAIPIMLRLAVIENLRRVCARIALDMIDYDLADYWAERLLQTVQDDPGGLILTMADMVRSKPSLTGPFVAAFTRSLQGKGPSLALPLNWMEEQLSVTGLNSGVLISQETQKQAADQVSVRNSIGTLRFLGATDWREFVETQSSVEQVLRTDKCGTYPLMDFATRDRYRHVVEAIAKASLLSETEVAQKVVDLAAQHQVHDQQSIRKQHVGYYLIGKGLEQTEAATARRYTLKQKINRLASHMPVMLYLGAITFVTLIVASSMWYLNYRYGSHNWMILGVLGILFLSGAAQLAISLINWLTTIGIGPKLMPRMDFSKGIPAEQRTIVVIPTMLSNKAYTHELIEGLEIRYLANKEVNLYFALLTDFTDAPQEHMPDDEGLLAQAIQSITALNDKYKANDGDDLFFLFHRSRTWNKKENKWMGYERKRGKLTALNVLLSTANNNGFSTITGNWRQLGGIKYVITLDSDTQLPREAAWKFIATMAHPLNSAVYDVQKKRVTEGYAILQPRVSSGIPTSATSLYLRMQGNVSGIDPYTRASSDVYQDLFGEGSFIGKGIYDVAIFEQALRGVFPENRILSHDLLEGCYVRSALLSDVVLYEDNPTQYSADVKRHHRWIRGDWQIGAWMLPFVTLGNGRLVRNKLSILSRWKIFDNLRRSMLPCSLLLLLLLGWTILPFPWFWTLAVTIIILTPVLAAAGWQLVHRPLDLKFKAHLSEVGISVRDILIRFVFGLAVLPYEALRNMDAIFRTNWRMIVSHKKLLEWAPSATASRNIQNDVWSVYRLMWVTPCLAITSSILFCYVHPQSLFVSFPILSLWLLAPAIAWRLSRPEVEPASGLSDKQLLFLHKTARKTWSYFEQFVTAEDNWLPPDNFQEEPVKVIAHRTSPTNMGLTLLANLTAYDFGYISSLDMTNRCKETLESMLLLERHKGHFYNWYDTKTRLPLQPRYVSAVDSGNLIGHLLTLKQGLLAQPHQPVFHQHLFEGIKTTALIVQDFSSGTLAKTVGNMIVLLNDAIAEQDNSLPKVAVYLDKLNLLAEALIEQQTEQDIYQWANTLSVQIKKIQRDLLQIIPWITLLPVPGCYSHISIENEIPDWLSVQNNIKIWQQEIDHCEKMDAHPKEKEWLAQFRIALATTEEQVEKQLKTLTHLSELVEQLSIVEYDFLYDRPNALLRIGYNVDEQRKDDSYYDLLASEIRLGIFVGIAQGKLPQESWFALGRLLTNSGGDPILLSWSGSMFEYLMPQLVMPAYENTLLYQTNRATVKRQIEYGAQRNVPWGISESAYNTVDAAMNYQYRAFGVPGLGLKRGLDEDLVIAPYASMMALMIMPDKACMNLEHLSSKGFEGKYGFYEAIDYTTSRLPRGKTHTVIPSYMVHHQGMGLLSLSYLLLHKPMQQRFVSELRFQATLLLLQERIPRATLFHAHTADLVATHVQKDIPVRKINTPHTPMPELQLLSNGRYQVMISNAGGGYSRWKDIAVTRWREDGTKDNHGIFCYIKDTDSGKFWSNTHQPTLCAAKKYEVIFTQGLVEIQRQDYDIDTKTEIVISPEDDVEMRRIRLTNRGSTVRILELTSYAETVMASQASDEAHPAFSNLFVQTEVLQDYKAIFSTRRPRSESERPPWMFHLMHVRGATVETTSYETDRMQFIGRDRTLVHPQAMDTPKLSGKQGSVLDPIMAIRYRISLKPGQTAIADLIFGISDTKEIGMELIHKYRDQHLKNRAFELSWTHSQVLLRQINATEGDAQLYDRLASAIIYTHPALRATANVIQSNYRGQSALWSHSVSGDLPIVLLHIYDPENMDLVKQMIQAHAYWRLKGLSVDLIIWNEDHGSYRQVLQDQILGLITAEASSSNTYNKPGNIYVKSADQLSAEDRILFESVARIIINGNRGSLTEQVSRLHTDKALPPLLETIPLMTSENNDIVSLPDNLLFFNGTGGFSADGKTYKILTGPQNTTPAPWVNVLANPGFGTIVSERGAAYSWAINAHEYRISPWSNDPVSDGGGEAFYLRDEESGAFWSPSPYPAVGKTPYLTTHGFGYSSFEHLEQGIYSEMRVFVDKDLPIKFVVLKIRNQSGRTRRFSATGYIEIILGDLRSKTNMHILSEQDKGGGTLFFRNRYNAPFTGRICFFKCNKAQPGFTMDRSEFLGRNRNLRDPQAMYRKYLTGKSGTGMDTCGALQVKFEMIDGAEEEIIFEIGNEINEGSAIALLEKFNDQEAVTQAYEKVQEYWREILEAIQVTTPDTALNVLANGWLIYQTLACRIFARSGFYQSGGAFGFRDQLQDVLALLYTQPDIAREQILLSASRQFEEGDVQHWWHPPEGRGVRTRCSDDLLWLPFVTSRYVSTTGDMGILSVVSGFLQSRSLHEDEDSLYDLPVQSSQQGTLYQHCVRAIKHSLRFGKKGLPLMGSGDWNDGMDQVGHKGLGESVWLAFFLYDVLISFTPIAQSNGDDAFAALCKQEAITLQANIEAAGWDGEWYIRAWFDDGTPLGAKANKECRIDAIAQSWSVLSGAGSLIRKKQAMDAVDKYLVSRDLKLIRLLDPPFDEQGLNPGYIKGYVPGVRENGGQYSHAAIWVMMAFAALGDREKVWELFNLVNPVNHATDAVSKEIYKVEPYVMAADVYANESHRGRGGWTWYTGSAGWMYQLITGSLLGMQLQANQLKFAPCFPLDWPSVFIKYRYGTAVYHISVFQDKEAGTSWWQSAETKGVGNAIPLSDDGKEHTITIHIGIKV